MKPRLAGAAADRRVSATAAPEPPLTEHDLVDQYRQPRQESEDEADPLNNREIEQ